MMKRQGLGTCFAAIGLALGMAVTTINVPLELGGVWFSTPQEAVAKSSGGRSRGGSFKKTSPSSGSSTRSKPTQNRSSGTSTQSQPKKSTSTSTQSSPKKSTSTQKSPRSTTTNSGSYRQSAPVIVPIPVAPPAQQPATIQNSPSPTPNNAVSPAATSSSGGNFFWTLVKWIIGLIVAVVGLLLLLAILMPKSQNLGYSSPESKQTRLIHKELDNDIVTITKLQVALLAIAGQIQQDLSDLVENADLETDEGLAKQLQEAALILLRTPENWSHVLASSQTVQTREEAETLFEKLSVAERNKLSAETLTNIKGRVRQRAIDLDPNEDPASYIVVTLLVGTAHDKALLGEIHDEEALENALKTLAAITPDYLLVFELIWSPQDKTDSLTYDELLTEYTDMIQIV